MKNLISPKAFALTLFLIILLSSCATLGLPLVPELRQRTLRFSPTKAELYYDYEICVKRLLGWCRKRAIKRDTYDLADPEIRKQLVAMDFRARVWSDK